MNRVAEVPTSAPAGPRGVQPVRRGRREIGAYATGPDGTVFVPAVDVTTIAVAALGAAALIATAVSAGVAVRRPPAVGSVTMGPGGWVSLRRSTAPALRAVRSSGHRPWWAGLLGAHRLVVQR
ncbi:hypothetical protein FHR83_008830 [Actinoplanes campanulatus]|uniref:Uncharacterized protein n=1 Tax=Actinoplanes campanulatus TaxID=113559 RepID=A0A7W5ARI7_9ACTN|nr:hypothetical protein [Actinoplanes campanulatus]MBB3101102.1 hypothetical protein [Actinoplanes campanulatus]GGN50892.1 hypothetical protein GCM10010109_90550 [Actinoplanes campanulatus]GID42668.1 hypothetical protein Aca09nite_91740 [Actinoplanes campanulatus]